MADERRAQLRALKLQALVRDHFGGPDGALRPYPAGAALVRDGEGWVLLENDAASGLGGARRPGRPVRASSASTS